MKRGRKRWSVGGIHAVKVMTYVAQKLHTVVDVVYATAEEQLSGSDRFLWR